MLRSLTNITDILCPGAFETQRLSKVKSKRASYLITQGNAAATFSLRLASASCIYKSCWPMAEDHVSAVLQGFLLQLLQRWAMETPSRPQKQLICIYAVL